MTDLPLPNGPDVRLVFFKPQLYGGTAIVVKVFLIYVHRRYCIFFNFSENPKGGSNIDEIQDMKPLYHVTTIPYAFRISHFEFHQNQR